MLQILYNFTYAIICCIILRQNIESINSIMSANSSQQIIQEAINDPKRPVLWLLFLSQNIRPNTHTWLARLLKYPRQCIHSFKKTKKYKAFATEIFTPLLNRYIKQEILISKDNVNPVEKIMLEYIINRQKQKQQPMKFDQFRQKLTDCLQSYEVKVKNRDMEGDDWVNYILNQPKQQIKSQTKHQNSEVKSGQIQIIAKHQTEKMVNQEEVQTQQINVSKQIISNFQFILELNKILYKKSSYLKELHENNIIFPDQQETLSKKLIKVTNMQLTISMLLNQIQRQTYKSPNIVKEQVVDEN